MDSYEVLYLLLFLLAMLLFLFYLYFYRDLKREPFAPVYITSAYFFLLFILRSIHLLNYGSVFLGAPPFTADIVGAWNWALLYLMLAYALFLAGYYSPLGPAVSRALPRLNSEWDSNKAIVLLPFLLVIAILSFYSLVQMSGGLSNYILNKQEALTEGGTTYLMSGTSLIGMSLIIMQIIFCKYRKWKWVAIALVPLVLGQAILSGSKGVLFQPVLSAFIVFHYLRRPVKFRYLLALVLAFVIITPFINIYRNATEVGQISKGTEIFADFDRAEFSIMGRFHALDAFIYIIKDTPAVMDYQLGGTVLPIFVAWIPRFLWPDKPVISFGKVFGETYFGNIYSGTGTAPSPTIIGDGYINLHVAGVILVAFFGGVFFRTVYDYCIKRNAGPAGVFVYSQLILSMIAFWESNISGYIPRTLFTLFLTLGIARLLGAPSGRRPAGG
ncbi:Hypothetical protein LUCI_4693 [Lucifera butyrica]|uniref:Oligosaccharide repeat unit polymerase n=2 Tax=Lucifera butyrica TaxID=1351585 RepID=A0A498RH14_9FIRM|nr:Hypothetical protein LUCI_4693 [Lucifera butyrica]